MDALGNPTGFHLTGGQACDLEGADVLLPQLEADTVIADKGFDADQRVLLPLERSGKMAVIPPKPTENTRATMIRTCTRRAIATRFDKTARNFLAAVYFVSAIIWLD